MQTLRSSSRSFGVIFTSSTRPCWRSAIAPSCWSPSLEVENPPYAGRYHIMGSAPERRVRTGGPEDAADPSLHSRAHVEDEPAGVLPITRHDSSYVARLLCHCLCPVALARAWPADSSFFLRYHPEGPGIFPRFCRHTFGSPRPRLIGDRRTIADSGVQAHAVLVRDIAAQVPLELVLMREADAVDDVALHRVEE